MSKKEIEIHVDKDNKIDLHEFIEMKIKYDEEYFKKDKEIERLNNVISELEKYLNEQVDYMTHHSIERMVAFDCCRHKLQELKGRNNDGQSFNQQKV